MTPATLAGGRYELAERLGRGGMAVVLLGRDTALDRPVAVKLLAGGLENQAESRERFLREGRFAAQLSHPNVVGVFDTGEQDGQPYIVMERVEGGSLAELLHRRGTLPAEEVAELGRQAAAGLAHAHARGVVHRDVKPQNLLLDGAGTLKVADFGIARSRDVSATLTQAGTVLGTAAYMAPEAVRGEPATPAGDVYGLGAVLYELATGRPPREVSTIADLARNEPPRAPSELTPLPRELEDTIMRCLASDPRHRPTAEEVAVELGAEPTLSQRPTEVLVGQAHGRRRVPWGRAAAGTIAVTLFLAAVVLDDDEPPPAPAVDPVPAASTPAQHARTLAAWLREQAR